MQLRFMFLCGAILATGWGMTLSGERALFAEEAAAKTDTPEPQKSPEPAAKSEAKSEAKPEPKADAKPAAPGKKISSIDIQGLKTLKENEIRPLLSKVGDTLNTKRIDEVLKEILKTDMFDEATARAEVFQVTGADTVQVIFYLPENPRLKSLKFVGGEKLSREYLKKLVDWKTGESGTFLSPRKIQEKVAAIRSDYEALGYYRPVISYAEEDGVLTFTIKEGSQAYIGRITFAGNKVFSGGELERQMVTKRRTMSGLWNPGVFSTRIFNEDVHRVEAYMHSYGYLDAKVTTTHVRLSADRSQLAIEVEVKEEKPYLVEEIQVETVQGDLPDLGPEQIQKMLRLTPGKTYNERILKEDIRTVTYKFKDQGYPFAHAEAELRYPEGKPNIVNLHFRIYRDTRNPDNRDPQPIVIEKIIPEGDPNIPLETRADVIQDEYASGILGEKYSQTKMDQTLRNMEETLLFEEIQALPVKETEPGKGEQTIRFKESDPGRVMLTLGYSERSDLFGALEIVHRNFDPFRWPKSWRDFRDGKSFRGQGYYLKIRIAPGVKANDASLDFENPRISGSPYFWGFGAGYSQLLLNKWDEDRLYGNVYAGRRLGRNHRLSLGMRAETVDLHGVKDDAPMDAWDAKGNKTLLTPRLAWRWNTLDERMEFPSTGHDMETAVEQNVADAPFTRITSNIRKYFPLYNEPDSKPHVVMVGGGVGWMRSTGNDEVPIYERYFMGGVDTLRGFAYRGAGPHRNGEAVGGLERFLFRTEYIFPLYNSGEKRVLGKPNGGTDIRGVIFCDAGWIGNQADSLDDPRNRLLHPPTKEQGTGSPRASTGFGFRLGVSRFSANIFFGIPVNAADKDEERLIGLSLGMRF